MKQHLTTLAIALLACATAIAQPSPNGNRDTNRDRSSDRDGDRGPDRGRWDPAAMQQRIMEGIKERLEITDDTEWKAIQPLVEKVMTAQRNATSDRFRGFMGSRAGSDRRGSDSSRPSLFAATPNPDYDTLQRAIDTKASKSELKAAMDKYAASRKARQAEVEAAQAELRKILTPRQEAIATLSGLL